MLVYDKKKEGLTVDITLIEDFVSKCAKETIVKVLYKGFLGKEEEIIGCNVRLHDNELEVTMETSEKLSVSLQSDRIISMGIIPLTELETLLRICEGILGKDLSNCRFRSFLMIISLLNKLLKEN